MTVWYKQGVIGVVSREIIRAIGVSHSLHQQEGEDLFVTALRDGNHSAGSLHYIGQAFDQRKGKVSREKLQRALSPISAFYEVIEESTHFHIEWDCGTLAKKECNHDSVDHG